MSFLPLTSSARQLNPQNSSFFSPDPGLAAKPAARMSGFEVAGIVLGAFPIAITALEKYRDVATRVNLFYAIRREHKKCRDELVFNHLLFKTNLRRLLLPLVVDDDKIDQLLADPGGPAWKEEELDNLLRKRMKNGYALYFEYIAEMKRVMDELNRELALDSEAVQKNVNSSVRMMGPLNLRDS